MQNGKTVLITGASGGIGYELALEFASHGYQLILAARSVEKLEKAGKEISGLYGIDPVVIPADLSDPAGAEKLFGKLAGKSIDILVNNAGTQVYGNFAENDLNAELG